MGLMNIRLADTAMCEHEAVLVAAVTWSRAERPGESAFAVINGEDAHVADTSR